MASWDNNTDEPLTPSSRLFVQPQLDQIIHCILGFKNPISIDSCKSTLKNSLLLQHPRFSSLLVIDSHGIEHWRPTTINIDEHMIIINQPVLDIDHQRAVNEYIADLTVSTPLSTEKPLWEIHLLMAHNCAVLRLHHSLGDGISLMSMLLASCRKVDDPDTFPTLASAKKSRNGQEKGWNDILWEFLKMVNSKGWNDILREILKMVWLSFIYVVGIGLRAVWVRKKKNLTSGRKGQKKGWNDILWEILKIFWFTFAYVVEFCLRAVWLTDKKTLISGGDGLQLWPRKSAVARFSLDDMKVVKGAVADSTINDVVIGIISAGLSKYLDHRSPKSLSEGLQLTGLAMVNLREQPSLHDLSDMMKCNTKSGWGNKFSMLLLPVYYYKSCTQPLVYLERAKAVIDRKKLSLDCYFTFIIGYIVMKYLGKKMASLLTHRVLCNTSFTISNVAGPLEEIALDGNPISYIRATSCAMPHALTMHMVSYAGRADMQILVAKDIIPDPEFLAKCFEEPLFAMKEVALANKSLG